MQLKKVRYEGSQPIRLLFCDLSKGDIGMGEARISSDRLLTTGVSTCTVIAGHNEETGRGLLGHFVAFSTEEEFGDQRKFHAALADIADLGDPLVTSIFLGGATPFRCEDQEENVIHADRQYAERETRRICEGFRLSADQVVVEWSEIGRAIDVELDCAGGILVVHDSPKDAPQLVYAPPE